MLKWGAGNEAFIDGLYLGRINHLRLLSVVYGASIARSNVVAGHKPDLA